MPRRPRIHIHLAYLPPRIVQRDHSDPCFFTEDNPVNDLHWWGEALSDFDCARHNHRLMSNHLHPHLLPASQRRASVPVRAIALARCATPATGHVPHFRELKVPVVDPWQA